MRAVFPNQAFLRDVFHRGDHVVLFGPVEFRGGLQLTNPEYEIVRGEPDEDDATVHTGRIVPIYEKAGSMTPRMQRVLMHRLLAMLPVDVSDPLPPAVREVMTSDVKYCYEDEDVEHVARNMGEVQVRRLPVVNRDKRLVGIVSIGDIAKSHDGDSAGEALGAIAQQGGQHTQKSGGRRR